MTFNMVQITFFLLFVVILTTGCVKDYDLNPFTTVMKHMIKYEKTEKTNIEN